MGHDATREQARASFSEGSNYLETLLGPKQSQVLIQECLKEANLREVTSAQELYTFAMRLMKRGGLIEAIGRSLKVKALLRGAKPD